MKSVQYLQFIRSVPLDGPKKQVDGSVDVKQESSVENTVKSDDPLNSLDPFWASKKGI